MTQNEVVWLLVGTIQFLVVGFVTYWMRRVQRLEDTISESIEKRTALQVEYHGRMSRLEEQYAQIIAALARIERRLDRTDSRLHSLNHEDTEED